MHENGANSYSRFDRKATIVSSHFNICMRDQCCLDLAHWKSDILQTSTDNKSHTSRQARRRTRKETSRQRHNHTSVHICKYTIAWRADKTITTYRYPFSRRRQPFPTKTRARIDLSPGSRGKRVPRTEDTERENIIYSSSSLAASSPSPPAQRGGKWKSARPNRRRDARGSSRTI